MNPETTSDASVIRAHVSADEKVLWTGRPAGGIKFRAVDVFMIPFSLLWGGFALFVIPWNLNGSGMGVVGILLPLFFKLMAIYITVGRFLIDMIRRNLTLYGLTDRSAVFLTTFLGTRAQVVALKFCSGISLQENGRGAGSVTFGTPAPFWAQSRSMSNAPQVPTFEYIDDARAVYELAQAARV